jgi:hypothetical protein
MQDANIIDDLGQLAYGQVKAREFSHDDINGYHFWITKLEATSPLTATSNNRVVTSAIDASEGVTD